MNGVKFSCIAIAVGLVVLAFAHWLKLDYFYFAGYTILQFIVLATAWNILGGYCGYVNFGSAAFFALGAYSSVFMYKIIPLPVPVLMLIGAVVSGIVGLGMGYLTLRLRGSFFAIATLALAVVLQTLVVNWDFVGGSRGAYIIRPETIEFGGFSINYIEYLFVLMLGLAVIVLTIAHTVERSRLGFGFATIRDDEMAAEASGVPTLDEMLHGGLERGTISLITGPSGTGKTTVGLQFMKEAAGRGERSVVYTFEEEVDLIAHRCESINIPVRAMIEKGSLSLVKIEPLKFTPDEFAKLVREEVESRDTRIVMLDSVAGYRLSLAGQDLVTPYVTPYGTVMTVAGVPQAMATSPAVAAPLVASSMLQQPVYIDSLSQLPPGAVPLSQQMLAQAGLSAEHVESGERALSRLKERPFDLVVSDVRMPGIDGLSLLAQVAEKSPETPVILMTAHGSVPLAVEAMKAGAADFVLKPFDREEILFTVRKALAKAPAQETPPPSARASWVSRSKGMEEVEAILRKAARSRTRASCRSGVVRSKSTRFRQSPHDSESGCAAFARAVASAPAVFWRSASSCRRASTSGATSSSPATSWAFTPWMRVSRSDSRPVSASTSLSAGSFPRISRGSISRS